MPERLLRKAVLEHARVAELPSVHGVDPEIDNTSDEALGSLAPTAFGDERARDAGGRGSLGLLEEEGVRGEGLVRRVGVRRPGENGREEEAVDRWTRGERGQLSALRRCASGEKASIRR